MYKITDRPGRFFALLVIAPLLVRIGHNISRTHPCDGAVLQSLGLLLFTYELFWISQTSSEMILLK